MHVDGFRFDLASILSRDQNGHPLPNPPILWDIESDPLLAGTNHGSVPALASRILGSPDLYGHEEREAEQSINFVTCHDGFTLNDLVSYNHKHNEANGEKNRDGSDDNLSWNYGTEGPTDDPTVEAVRNRQVRNFFALTLLAVGTPMVLMGDEVRRTQRGNNNAYCQDSDISWFDWSLLERYGDIHRFVKGLNEFRQRRDVVVEGTALSLNELLRRARIEWHGVALKRPDWSDHSHSLAFTLRSLRSRFLLHGMLNAYWEPLTFELPAMPAEGQQAWRRCIDTALDSPDDICPWETAPVVTQATYVAQPRSVVLLALALEGSMRSVRQVG